MGRRERKKREGFDRREKDLARHRLFIRHETEKGKKVELPLRSRRCGGRGTDAGRKSDLSYLDDEEKRKVVAMQMGGGNRRKSDLII